MIIVNTDFVPGREVGEAVGLVRGSTIRAKHLGKDLMAALRTIFGGEVKEYTEMLVERAAWIPSSDRALIEAVHGEGLSVVAYVRRCLDRGIEPVERDAIGKPLNTC